jgi:ankyrin repeat protein
MFWMASLIAPLWAADLHLAAAENDVERARQLIEQGEDVNERMPGGWTPLMIAAKYGATNVMESLIRANARIDATNREGNTALLLAVIANQPNSVRMLIGYRADATLKNECGMDAREVA